MYLSRTPAPQDITSWHLGKTKSYRGWHSGKNWPGSERVKIATTCNEDHKCYNNRKQQHTNEENMYAMSGK